MRPGEGGRLDQLALRADARADHEELETEEDNRIEGGTAAGGGAVLDPVTDEREIEGGIERAVEVIGGDKPFQRDQDAAIQHSRFRRTEHEAAAADARYRGRNARARFAGTDAAARPRAPRRALSLDRRTLAPPEAGPATSIPRGQSTVFGNPPFFHVAPIKLSVASAAPALPSQRLLMACE